MYTVLAIVAHPDDMEADCGGTLLACKKRGDRVVVCNLSDGNLGHEVIMPDELAKIREAEAKRSCDLAGFEHMWGGFHDLSLYPDNKEARDKVVKVIREVDPDFIITHTPDDYMPDHIAVSRLVFDASFAATCPHYPPMTDKPARLVPIYYMTSDASVNFDPDEYVDVSEFMEKKLDMIRCHESQIVWLRDHDGIDFAEDVRALTRATGYKCGADYAEGFKMCRAYLRGTTKRYLP